MSDIVLNKVLLYGDPKKIQELREFMRSDVSAFDLNKLSDRPRKQRESNAVWKTDYLVEFHTNNTCPVFDFRKITKRFPDVGLEVSFANKDGSYSGTIDYYRNEFDLGYLNSETFASYVWNTDN